MSRNLFGIELFHPRRPPPAPARAYAREKMHRRWTSPESPLDKVEPYHVRPHTRPTRPDGKPPLKLVG